jgi:hypothetical protein
MRRRPGNRLLKSPQQKNQSINIVKESNIIADVIPHVLEVLKDKRNGREKKHRLPGKCPVCGGNASRPEDELIRQWCHNTRNRSLVRKLQKLILDPKLERRCQRLEGKTINERHFLKLLGRQTTQRARTNHR